MNIKEYISSGIVESYVLGLASPEECLEFERLCTTYSEVLEARKSFERELEEKLTKQQLQVPRELKSRIFSEIGMENITPPPTIAFKKPALVPRANFTKYVAAASLLLLAGSVLLNLYLIAQYKKSIAQNKELLSSQIQIADVNQVLKTRLQLYDSAVVMMANPQMTMVKMTGLPSGPAPSSLVTLFWNNNTKSIYLLINHLPKPVAGKQYQLWAIVNGKPVNAGVLAMDNNVSFMKLNAISDAQAFAVTLEKKGGSDTPTMSEMFVMGRVNS